MAARTSRELAQLPSRVQLSWTSVIDLTEGTRETSDPLGFRSAAGRWAGKLVPVFTAGCDTTRQLSMLCLGLKTAHAASGGSESIRERFLRFERLWLLALARDGNMKGNLFSGGLWAKAQLKQLDGDGGVDLTVPALQIQLAGGLWGRTRRAASELQLITGRRGGPEHWQLTPQGDALATEGRYQVADTNAAIGAYVKRDRINNVDLSAVFARDRAFFDLTSSFPESRLVGETLVAHDRRHDGEFRALYTTWKQDRRLSLSSAPGNFRPEQQRALQVLAAIDSLARRLEKPYRAWLRGEPAAIDRTIATRPEWAAIRRSGEGALLDLNRRLVDSPSFDSVQEFHELLAERRGSRPWSRSDLADPIATVPTYQRIEHRLASASRLFEQGVTVKAGSA